MIQKTGSQTEVVFDNFRMTNRWFGASFLSRYITV